MTTAPFVTNSGDYLAALLPIWLRRRWLLIAIPLLIMVGVGVKYDSRWLFVALIVTFIIVPMLLSGIYSYYMLTPEVSRALLRKTVTFNPDGSVTLDYLPPLKNVKVTMPDGTVVTRSEETEPPSPLPLSETIPATDIKKVTSSGNYRVYILNSGRLRLLLVPNSLIPAI